MLKCSIWFIVKVFFNGCWVIEFDCYDGKDGKIKVFYGGYVFNL